MCSMPHATAPHATAALSVAALLPVEKIDRHARAALAHVQWHVKDSAHGMHLCCISLCSHDMH